MDMGEGWIDVTQAIAAGASPVFVLYYHVSR